MKKSTMIGGLLALGLIAATGLHVALDRREKETDAASLSAQKRATGGSGVPDAMAKRLGLSETQAAAMRAGREAMMKRMASLPKGDPKAMMAAMEEERKRIEATLTPEQRQKLMASMPPFPGGAMGGKPFGGGQ